MDKFQKCHFNIQKYLTRNNAAELRRNIKSQDDFAMLLCKTSSVCITFIAHRAATKEVLA